MKARGAWSMGALAAVGLRSWSIISLWAVSLQAD